MPTLYNRALVSTATTGTGTMTLGAAVSASFFTFAEAGVPNGAVVPYVIEDGTNVELGFGTYSSTGPTLTRDTVRASKIGGTAGTTKLTLSGAAVVFIDAMAQDLVPFNSVSGTATATIFSAPQTGGPTTGFAFGIAPFAYEAANGNRVFYDASGVERFDFVMTGTPNFANYHTGALHSFYSYNYAAELVTIDATKLNVKQTTPSTSPTTGALTVAGGVGVGGDIYTAQFLRGDWGIGINSVPDLAGWGSTWRVLTIKGNLNGGVVEYVSDKADASGNYIGFFDYIALANTAAGNPEVANIYGQTSGTTANNRGGLIAFATKPDGPGTPIERLRIDHTGLITIAGALSIGARVVEGVVTLTDGATPALNAALGNIFLLVAAGDRTIAVPSNPVNGQKIVIRHNASGAIRTLALNTGAGGFRFGSDITALTATVSGKTDYIGAIYNSTANFWDVVAYSKGF